MTTVPRGGYSVSFVEVLSCLIGGALGFPKKLLHYAKQLAQVKSVLGLIGQFSRPRGNIHVALRSGEVVVAETVLELLAKLDQRSLPDSIRFDAAVGGPYVVKLFGVGYDYALSEDRFGLLVASNRTVLDVGASVGDTPIFFISRGAREVWAIEASPSVAELCRKNIESNGLGNVIHTLTSAVSSGEEDDRPLGGGWETGNALESQGRVCSFRSLLRLVQGRPLLLKASCEGCEQSLTSMSSSELAEFEQIFVEFFGPYRQLVRQLRLARFEVQVRGRTMDFSRRRIRGFIYAVRRDSEEK